MNIKFLWLLCLALGTVPLISFAATITTGDLAHNTETGIISSSSGKYYLNWSTLSSYTYQQTLDATSDGGEYAAYHIASELEAVEYYNSATYNRDFNNNIIGVSQYFNDSDSRYSQGAFGDNYNQWNSIVFFISSVGADYYGQMALFDGGLDIHDYNGAISTAETWSSDAHISWLLVGNDGVIPTPVIFTVPAPAPALLMLSGLIALLGFKRTTT